MRVWFRSDATCRRLATIPGVGPIVATALVAAIGDPSAFGDGRNLAAWLGLTPRQNSTGGKARLGGITKRGDGYLRRLLINGAQAVLRWSKTSKRSPWLEGICARKTGHGGGRRPSQQDGSDHLGGLDPLYCVQSAGARGRLAARKPATRACEDEGD